MQPEVIVDDFGNIELRYEGQEWILPPDLVQMILSDQSVRDLLKRRLLVAFKKTTITYITTPLKEQLN